MPLQNRVTPTGEIIATSARGMFMGNRGILHDEHQRIVRSSRNAMWLVCRLGFKDRRRELMAPGNYTELFFLDEAVALAAGHRPCGECRRTSYRAFLDAAGADRPLAGPRELDRRLNESRRAARTSAPVTSMPDGVFVAIDGPRLVWRGSLHRWTPFGYVDPMPASTVGATDVVVVTPSLTVAALRHGYPVVVHPSVSGGDRESEPRHDDARRGGEAGVARGGTPRDGTWTREMTAMESTLTPELRSEIERHLRVNPVRHGEVFRAMERGLDVGQMDTSRDNAQKFKNSVDAMLAGTLPVTKTAAETNSYGYKYLLGCDLSPELLRHTKAMLRKLAEINPDIDVDKPLQIRSLPDATRRPSAAEQGREAACPQCFLVHAGECD